MEAQKVSESIVRMTELVLPTHTNSLGGAFGGVIVSWIDVAAAIAAQRHSSSSVVTASIDDLHFFAPVYKGWVVNLIASINYVANTSMEIGVRLDAENPISKEHFHVATAYLTFVAIDDLGRPKKVPDVILETKDEIRRNKLAIKRRELRLARRDLLKNK